MLTDFIYYKKQTESVEQIKIYCLETETSTIFLFMK